MQNQLAIIFKISGILITTFSFTYLIPVIVALLYQDQQSPYFLITFALSFAIGITLWLPTHRTQARLKTRHGFIIVTLFWSLLSIISALPLHLSPAVAAPWSKAIFEATSGFTTTGATILTGLDYLPKSILWYRTQLHFFGGMGIIILAVAIMPLLGMGGMALYKAEIPGLEKENKMTPRIAQTARNLWLVYIILLAACAFLYLLGGMDLFDAITHAFTTVATAGFSNYDASIGYFDNRFIEYVAILFMLLGGLNFTTHFLAFSRRDMSYYTDSSELKVFLTIILLASLLIGGALYLFGEYETVRASLHHALFAVSSMMTTTGLAIDNFSAWPSFIPILILFLSFIGGSSGSTAGGLKVARVMLLAKQIMREIKLLVHPRALLPIRINGQIVPNPILGSVWAFLGLYALSTALLTLVMIAFGLSPIDAFSAVAACLNITGPGLGEVASNYASLSDGALSVLIFTMILGRLEIFTVFVLLVPSFWRH